MAVTTTTSSGIKICDAPKCSRQLKPDQGKIRELRSGRQIRTCFGVACQSWADDQEVGS